MKKYSISRPRIHFTTNHEWIDFNGTVGFVGISAFRLREVASISKITWHQKKGSIEKGDLIAKLYTENEVIEVHAPVGCKFLGMNPNLACNLSLILSSPQDQGWLFFVTPSVIKNREHLLLPNDYQSMTKSMV